MSSLLVFGKIILIVPLNPTSQLKKSSIIMGGLLQRWEVCSQINIGNGIYVETFSSMVLLIDIII